MVATVVKPPANGVRLECSQRWKGRSCKDVLSQRDTEEVEHSQAYLHHVREHLLTQTNELNLLVTWSVTPAQDVAATIVTIAEKGTGGTGENSCAVLAMATHGHGGIERWVMGSVTERVLGASTMPMLVIRPPQGTLHTEKSKRNPRV